MERREKETGGGVCGDWRESDLQELRKRSLELIGRVSVVDMRWWCLSGIKV